jgi:hypothetical protein
VMAEGRATGRPFVSRTITGRKEWRDIIPKSARKSTDSHTWGFENGVV